MRSPRRRPWPTGGSVVDSGSTDATVGIVRAHGQVLHFDWLDDFAVLRNASRRPAHGERVVVPDATRTLPRVTPRACVACWTWLRPTSSPTA